MTAATVTETKEAPSVWTAPAAAYALFASASIFLLHPTVFDMVRIWASSSNYTHGFVVAPIALWMMFDRRSGDFLPATSLTPVGGVIAASLLWLLGRAAGAALIEQIAFVSLLIAGAGVIFGMEALKRWAFPLGFLYFMVPFGEALIPALQTQTAMASVWLLNVSGVAASLDGYLIRTDAGAFEVAEACAGLRFLLAAIMVATIFAYMSFSTWRKRISFLLFAIGVSLVANTLRAYLLIFLATISDMKIATGTDHVFYGVIFYAVVFAFLLYVGDRMSDRVRKRFDEPAAMLRSPWRMKHVATALAVVFSAAVYGNLIIDRPIAREAPSTLSLLNAPGWRILPPPQNWRAELRAADRSAAATYARENETVYAAIGYFAYDRHDAEIVDYANRAWDGQYWRRIGERKDVIYLFGESEETPFHLLAAPQGRRLAAVTAWWLDGKVYTNPAKLKFAQMKAKIFGRNPSGGVIILAASYAGSPDEALSTLRNFTVTVEEFDKWLARNNGS